MSTYTVDECKAVLDELENQISDMKAGNLPVVHPRLMTDDLSEVQAEHDTWTKLLQEAEHEKAEAEGPSSS